MSRTDKIVLLLLLAGEEDDDDNDNNDDDTDETGTLIKDFLFVLIWLRKFNICFSDVTTLLFFHFVLTMCVFEYLCAIYP